jgi:hypothetical protein
MLRKPERRGSDELHESDEVLAEQVRGLGRDEVLELHKYLSLPKAERARTADNFIGASTDPTHVSDLARFVASANDDEMARLRLLRAIRDA